MNQLEQIRDYWNTRAEGYSKSIQEELAQRGDEWAERFKKVLDETGGKKVLDIGCGPGMFSVILTQLGCDVTSFDYSDEMLEEAKRNVRSEGRDATFLRGDAQNLPFEPNTFDLIVSRNLTWNLEHPEKAYAEWLRVLKPEGRLLNFDGNHYLHYYNQRYGQARELENYRSGQGHKYMENVDVTIIDRIAEALPLSKVERPQWDMETLLSLKVSEVSAQVEWKAYEKDGELFQIANSFFIKAKK